VLVQATVKAGALEFSDVTLASVIAFSGQAETQRPQERQASTFGV
jgi:hypothetical protein